MAQPQAPVHDARPLVVHVVHRFAVGGLENGVVNLINRLPASRWRHAVLSLTDVSGDFCRRVQRDDVLYLPLNKGPGHLAPHYPRLFGLFRAHRPAIVHTRNLAALEAQVPAWLARVPGRIHGEHGWDVADLEGKRRRYRIVRRLYRPFVQRYVALSQHIEDYLLAGVGVRPDDLDQIYNGVDTARFRPAPAGREAVAGSPFDDPRCWLVGTVGRLQSVKDQVTLAKAFVRALELDREARARMRLVIAGDGPLRDQVLGVLQQAGVADLAWLAGARDDVPAILRGLDLFVLPSLAEGISNTILEAMASGLPVVATRVGGNAELVEDGLTGRLVPAAGFEALASAILDYFKRPQDARRHGRAGRVRAERQFSLDRMAADYDRLYARMLARKTGPAARPSVA
jgi:sugar transferase (PEP-CTERM/EpsH1 system associated)